MKMGDLVQKVSELAVAAAHVEKVSLVESPKGDSDNHFYLTDGKGRFEAVEKKPSRRRYSASTEADFVGQVRYHAGAPSVKGKALTANDSTPNKVNFVVFTDGGLTQCVMDEDGKRRDTITMNWPVSPIFARVQRLASDPCKLSQRDLLNLMRVELACKTAPDNFVERISTLKMTTNADGLSISNNQTDTFGKRVQNQVLGIGDEPLPSEVTLRVPVYDSFVFSDGLVALADVKCAFQVLPMSNADAAFVLTPLAGQCIRAMRSVDALLLSRLRESLSDVAGVAVFGGKANITN